MLDDNDVGIDLGFELEGDGNSDDEHPAKLAAAGAASGAADRAAILKRHRQEEQQLRTEHKQMIFAVPKSDKAGRQAAEEVRNAVLHAMQQRHAAELGEELADSVAGLSLGPYGSGSKGGGGKKKSQRQKKEEAERARDKRIADHRAGAGPSERDVEIGKLTAQLTPLGLALHEIPADGHCLYRSLAHLLQAQGDVSCDYATCRCEIANHMRAHAADFVPFLAETGAADLPSYCEQVEGSSEWGGQLEITALAHSRKACIVVYSADAPPLTTGEEYATTGNRLELAYHRHYYGLGEHYNAVVPVSIQPSL